MLSFSSTRRCKPFSTLLLTFLAIRELRSSSAFGIVKKGYGLKHISLRAAPPAKCTPTALFMASTQQNEERFAPIKSFFDSLMGTGEKESTKSVQMAGSEYDKPIEEALSVLYTAAETRAEDSDKVYNALVDLEKLQRQKRKAEASVSDDYPTAKSMLQNLKGEWRLIFTTGTQETQNKLGGGRINYFPIKVCGISSLA